MSMVPGTRSIRKRSGVATIGTVSSVLEADPFTQAEIGVTTVIPVDSTKPVYHLTNHDTTDNDISD